MGLMTRMATKSRELCPTLMPIQQVGNSIVGVEHLWPAGTPAFPLRDDVVQYVSSFVERHNLAELIFTRTPVSSMAFDDASGTWETSAGNGVTLTSRFVAFAGGSLGAPVVQRFRRPGKSRAPRPAVAVQSLGQARCGQQCHGVE